MIQAFAIKILGEPGTERISSLCRRVRRVYK